MYYSFFNHSVFKYYIKDMHRIFAGVPVCKTWESKRTVFWDKLIHRYCDRCNSDSAYFHFKLDNLLAKDGFFAMHGGKCCLGNFKVDHQFLASIAAEALLAMRKEFKHLRTEFNALGASSGGSVKDPPTTISAMAFEGRIYLTSSAKNKERRSLLSLILPGYQRADYQMDPRILQMLQQANLYDTTKDEPILHHQSANCSEMAMLRLWANVNPYSQLCKLRNNPIVTVHKQAAETPVFAPCSSCKPVLEKLGLDYAIQEVHLPGDSSVAINRVRPISSTRELSRFIRAMNTVGSYWAAVEKRLLGSDPAFIYLICYSVLVLWLYVYLLKP